MDKIEITINDAPKIDLSQTLAICDKCHGLPLSMVGYIDSAQTETIKCKKCNGSGVVIKLN